MKNVLIFFSLFFLMPGINSQNNTIRGIVKLQSSGSQPLRGVKLSAFGAGSVFTNDNGMFEMTFQGKKPGSPISLFVQKDGYELINDKELDNCVIRQDPDDLILVVMARQGERNKQALAYYDIIIENTNNNYNKQLDNIHSRLDALDEDDKSREVLRQQIEDLQIEKEELLNRAEELATQLASVDLDRASSLAKDAYKEFNNGNIKSALLVLSDEALDQNFKEAQEEYLKIKQRLTESESALSQSIENYMIKARFCSSDRQYDKAFENYMKAYNADSTNVKNVAEIGDYCDDLNQQQLAIRFYNQALKNNTSDPLKAILLINLGNQFSYNNNYPKAAEHYMQAYTTAEVLVEENRETYGQIMAESCIAFGQMYAEWNNDEKSEEYYLKALDLLKELAVIDPVKHNPVLANALRSLGDLYSRLMLLGKAQQSLTEALGIFNGLDGEGKHVIKEQIAASHLAIAILKARSMEFEQADSSFAKAIDILLVLSEENPFRYEPQLASTQMSSSVMYYHWGKYDLSEKGYLTTIETYQRLIDENPRRYEPALARTYLNLGSLYSTLEQYDASEEAYMKSLQIRKRLADEDPQRFIPSVCHVLLNIAFMKKRVLYQHYDMSQIDQALTLIDEVEKILEPYDNNIPWVKKYLTDANRFKPYFIGVTKEDLMVQTEIDNLETIEKSIESEPDLHVIVLLYQEIIDTLLNIRRLNPGNNRVDLKLSETYGNLSLYQLYTQQFKKAEESALKGIKFNEDEIWINSYLALALAYQGKTKKAIKIYKEFMNSSYQGDSLKDYFLEDLVALEASGIIHEDNKKLKEALN